MHTWPFDNKEEKMTLGPNRKKYWEESLQALCGQ